MDLTSFGVDYRSAYLITQNNGAQERLPENMCRRNYLSEFPADEAEK